MSQPKETLQNKKQSKISTLNRHTKLEWNLKIVDQALENYVKEVYCPSALGRYFNSAYHSEAAKPEIASRDFSK
jgi:hypothetical protein